jgi:hypothetical protein
MPQVVRPGLSHFHPFRSAPIKSGDDRDPLWRHRLSEGEILYDPMLLDPLFDELGCDASILLKIVNQP